MNAGETRTFVKQRRAHIAEILRTQGHANVTELAEDLGISRLTIRRDLDYLEKIGVAQRRYGGAELAEKEAQASSATDNQGAPARKAIAAAAAQLVESNDLIFVNTSSTALEIVSLIEAEGVTVVTNSARARDFPIPPSGMILLTGGEVRPPRSVLSGEFALNNVRNVLATSCFLGCAGISITSGITSTTQQEAIVNSLMVERSDRMILLADSGKLGIGAGFSYASLDRVTLLITDTGATDEDVNVLLNAGIHEIHRVEPADQ